MLMIGGVIGTASNGRPYNFFYDRGGYFSKTSATALASFLEFFSGLELILCADVPSKTSLLRFTSTMSTTRVPS